MPYMFNGRHYRALALAVQDALRHADKPSARALRKFVSKELSAALRYDSSDFNREAFIVACEPDANVTPWTVTGPAKRVRYIATDYLKTGGGR